MTKETIFLVSNVDIKFISSLDNSKSNTLKFSFKYSILTDFDIHTIFLCNNQRKIICAIDFLYLSAIFCKTSL